MTRLPARHPLLRLGCVLIALLALRAGALPVSHSPSAADAPALATEPRILSAEWSGRWQEGGLAGEARLVVQRRAEDGRVLHLAPLNAVLGSQATLDGQPAVLGEIDGGRFGLVTDFLGKRTLRCQWWLRSERRADGWSFLLQLPSTPLSQFTLELPADHWLEFLGQNRLAPQLELANAEIWRWRIALGSEVARGVEFQVRQGRDPGKPPLLLSKASADHDLTPAGVESRFEYELERIHGDWRRLELEADPDLEITQVQVRRPDPQPVQIEPLSGEPRGRYRLSLSSRLERRATLELRGRVPRDRLHIDQRWSPPWMRLRGSHPASDVVRVHTAPELSLTDWSFGDYRPAAPPALEKRGNEPWEIWTLAPGLSASPGVLRLPTAHLHRERADLHVRQEAWWHVAPDHAQYTVRAWWQVQFGRLAALPMQIPPGWEVEDVELSPSGFLREQSLEPAGTGRLLTLHLREPVDASVPLRVTVRLRSTEAVFQQAERRVLTIPHVDPVRARWQQTQLAITLERGKSERQPLLVGRLQGISSTGTAPIAWSQPWSGIGPGGPDFVATCFGRDAKGTLEVVRAAPLLQTRAVTTVSIRGSQPRVRYEVHAVPQSGAPTQLTLELDAPAPRLQWQVAGQRIELHAVHQPSADSNGRKMERYNLEFPQPLSGPVMVHAEYDLPADHECSLPLVRCQDDPGFSGQVCIHGSFGCRLAATGAVRVMEPPAGSDPQTTWYRYTRAPASVLLDLRQPAGTALPPVVANGLLTIRIAAGGDLHCTYLCKLSNSQGKRQKLVIPVGAAVLSATLDGEAISIHSAVRELELLPRTESAVLRMFFLQGTPNMSPFTWLHAELPEWPTSTVVLPARVVWHVPEDWRPVAGRAVERLPDRRSYADLWSHPPRWSEVSAFASRLTDSTQDHSSVWLERAMTLWDQSRAEMSKQPLLSLLALLEHRLSDSNLRIVVDLAALDEAGLVAAQPSLPASTGPPWEVAGLTLIPSRTALLLTTRRRLQFDEAVGSAGVEWTYGQSLADALEHGQDDSGRFRSLASGQSAEDADRHAALATGVGKTGWWMEAGASASPPVLFVSAQLVLLASASWGLLIYLLIRATAPRASWIAVLLMGVALLLFLWIPEALQPLPWAQFLGALAGLLRRPAMTLDTARQRSPSALVGGLLLTLGLGLSPAQGGALATTADAGRTPAAPSYVLLSAAYRGQAGDEEAVFSAVFDVELLRDGTTELPLPLRSVRLMEAFWDDAPASAAPLPQGEGFLFRVAGAGRHQLRLRCATTITRLDASREVRFATPALTASRLSFLAPGSVRSLHATGVRGVQTVRALRGLQELDAHQGHAREIVVRWRVEDGQRLALRVREMFAWDLRTLPRLHMHMDYEVSRGAIEKLALLLPPALTPRFVEVRSAEPQQSPSRLENWHVESGPDGRALVLLLAAPAVNRFQVLAEFMLDPALAVPFVETLAPIPFAGPPGLTAIVVAQATLARHWKGESVLQLSVPFNPEAERVEGHICFSDEADAGIEVQPASGWTELRGPERPGVWPGLTGPLGESARVYRYRGAAGTLSRVRLAQAQRALQLEQALSLLLDGSDVEMICQLQLNVQRGELIMLGLQLPPQLTQVSVQGEHVLRATQERDRVQVWFRRPLSGESTLQVRGRLQAIESADRTARLPLPQVKCAGQAVGPVRLTLQARPGTEIQWARRHGLAASGSAPSPEDVWLSVDGNYDGELLLRWRAPATSDPVQPLPTPSDPPASDPPRPTRVLLAEYAIQPSLWHTNTSSARYSVEHGPSALLEIVLPDEATLLHARIGGRAVVPRQDQRGRVHISMPSRSGVSVLELSWSGSDGGPGQPLPLLVGVEPFPALVQIESRSGFSLCAEGFVSGRAAAVERAVRRAEILLPALDVIAKHHETPGKVEDLRSLLRGVESDLRSAETLLDAAAPSELAARLAAARRGLETQRTALALPPPVDALTPPGQQGLGLGPALFAALEPGTDRIAYTLETAEAASRPRAIALTLLLSALVLGALAVARAQRLRQVLLPVWPELAVLAGLAWWFTFPTWLAGLCLLLTGFLGRVVCSARGRAPVLDSVGRSKEGMESRTEVSASNTPAGG